MQAPASEDQLIGQAVFNYFDKDGGGSVSANELILSGLIATSMRLRLASHDCYAPQCSVPAIPGSETASRKKHNVLSCIKQQAPLFTWQLYPSA